MRRRQYGQSLKSRPTSSSQWGQTRRNSGARGRLEGLAAVGTSLPTTSRRSPVTPDLPTVGETVPGYEATIWIGLMAPKGTPKDVVTFLNTSINKVINLPEVKATWLKQGAIPLIKTPAEFETFLHQDIEKWAHVVKVSGAQIGK